MKYRKAKKADLDQVVRVASTAFEDYLFLKVIKDLVRDPKQYPAFYEKATSCAGPSKDESNPDVRHARHLRPGLLLAIFKENFNGRHLAFYLDSSFGLCLV